MMLFIKHVLALSFAVLALAAPQTPSGLGNQTLGNTSIVFGGAGGDSVEIKNNTISNNTISNNTVGPGALSNNTVNARSESGS